MTDLQKEFESTGFASWVNSDLYPEGKVYTNEYVKWLEAKLGSAEQKHQCKYIRKLGESCTANNNCKYPDCP